MNSQAVIELFKQHVIANYTRYPVCLVRGEGSYVWDAEGNRYLDFFPGWGCDLIGHCPPRVVEAIRDQVGKLIHVPNTWYTAEQGLLAQRRRHRVHAHYAVPALVVREDVGREHVAASVADAALAVHAHAHQARGAQTSGRYITSRMPRL